MVKIFPTHSRRNRGLTSIFLRISRNAPDPLFVDPAFANQQSVDKGFNTRTATILY